MNTIQLPKDSKERKEAVEKQIAHYLAKAGLIFPTEKIGKELFLTMLSEHYANNKELSKGHNTSWGNIANPVKFIKDLKNEPWEYEGVKKHYEVLLKKVKPEDLEHWIRLWYVKLEHSEIEELAEQFYSDDEEIKEKASETLQGLGVWRLEDCIWEEFNRIYNLPSLEFLENYYQYLASTREDNPLEEKHLLAKIEYIQGQLFDCICYDLIPVEGELNIAQMKKIVDLVDDSSSTEEKIAILKKLLYLYPYHRYYTPNPIYPENPGYWIYSEVIETLGEIGGKEAEEVLQDIVQGDYHHEEIKEAAAKQLKMLEEIHTLDNLPSLEDIIEK